MSAGWRIAQGVVGLVARQHAKCGAIARNDVRYTPGFGNSQREAVKKAKAKARKGPGKVKLVAFVCSG